MSEHPLKAEARLALTRVGRSDFHLVRATGAEREALAAAGVVQPLAQDYAAWRKSLLWVSGVCLLALALFQLVTFETFASQLAAGVVASNPGVSRHQATQHVKVALGKDNLDLVDGFNVLLLLSGLLGAIFTVVAARRWKEVRASKRWAFAAWATMFLTPFALSLLPVTGMMEWDKVDERIRKGLQPTFGILFALQFFVLVGPKAMSLFPAVVRSSVTLRTLLPEQAAPGWAAVLTAPLATLFLAMVASTVIQLSGDVLLLAGVVFLGIAPLVYVKRAGLFVTPHTAEEMSEIAGSARRLAMVFNAIGIFLVVLSLILSKLFGVLKAIEFALAVSGSLLLISVVASDIVLAILWRLHAQEKEFRSTLLAASLDRRFEELAAAGFTALGGGDSRSSGANRADGEARESRS